MVILVTGKAGAGKTTYAARLREELEKGGNQSILIDADEFRHDSNNHDFSDEGRYWNLITAAKMASLYENKGYITILAFISPLAKWREEMRTYWKESLVIYIPGGTLWKDTTYEPPSFNELCLRTQQASLT